MGEKKKKKKSHKKHKSREDRSDSVESSRSHDRHHRRHRSRSGERRRHRRRSRSESSEESKRRRRHKESHRRRSRDRSRERSRERARSASSESRDRPTSSVKEEPNVLCYGKISEQLKLQRQAALEAAAIAELAGPSLEAPVVLPTAAEARLRADRISEIDSAGFMPSDFCSTLSNALPKIAPSSGLSHSETNHDTAMFSIKQEPATSYSRPGPLDPGDTHAWHPQLFAERCERLSRWKDFLATFRTQLTSSS